MTDDLLEQLNRAVGSRTGGRPQFTAEAEGDDYLFGRLPGSKYSGVAALWNGDQHLVDPAYAPREEWSIIDAETIEHDRKPNDAAHPLTPGSTAQDHLDRSL